MIIEDSSGDVDGLVALEIGRKDDDKSAQLVIVVILDHADGWPERADNNDNALSFLSWPDLAAKLGRSAKKTSSSPTL